jgi:hypothetical protein
MYCRLNSSHRGNNRHLYISSDRFSFYTIEGNGSFEILRLLVGGNNIIYMKTLNIKHHEHVK